MRDKKFLQRLRTELPVWVQRGWVTAGSEQQILNHVAAKSRGGARYAPLAFGVLGVLLLGAGVITYFAAHWDGMSKLAKLAILFGSMWAAYLSSVYFMERRALPHLGHAMLLLGVILFGANIMLIGQIYHIDAHYPAGLMVWSLGGLLVAYLMRSQAAMITCGALAVLWTGTETLGFDRLHWPFLILWVLSVLVIYRERWIPAWHVALIGILLWSWFVFQHLLMVPGWPRGGQVYLAQIYFLVYLGSFILGAVIETYERPAPFAAPARRYAVFATLASFYLLTFPWFNRWREDHIVTPDSPWLILTLIALLFFVGAAVWHHRWTRGEHRSAILRWGQGLLSLFVIVLLANLFVIDTQRGTMAILFNLLFFAGLIWLIYSGLEGDDHFLVNIGFVFFGLTLLSRYFDTFWSLLNRSFFFMVGGVLLIGGGYLLEKQRRRLTGQIAARTGEGGRA